MRKLSYIDRINEINQWAKMEFPSKHTHLAMFLILDRFNDERWPDEIVLSLFEFMGIIRAGSKSQAIEIRNEMVSCGFLVYEPGKKGAPSRYSLGTKIRYSQETLFSEKGTKKGSAFSTLFSENDDRIHYSNNNIYIDTFNRRVIKTEDGSEPKKIRSEQEAVILLPLNTGEAFSITREDAAEWARLYPNVDVYQELNKMRGWLLANPTRRKTRNGIMRFVNNWLSREQDRGGRGCQRSERTERSTGNQFFDLLTEKGDARQYEQRPDHSDAFHPERQLPQVLPGHEEGGD